MHSVDSGYHIWDVPERAERVRFVASVLEFIDKEVRDAYRKTPRRGMEIAGLLLGSVTHQHGHAEFVIESAETIACDHQNGPAFLLSNADREKLGQQKLRLAKEGRMVVGYFRSHTSGAKTDPDPSLDTQDPEMLGTANLFLLLRPISVARVRASLIRCQDGIAVHQTGYLPFPFTDPAALRAMLETPQFDVPAVEPGISQESPQQSGPTPQKRTGRTWTWFKAFGVVLLAVACGLVYWPAAVPARAIETSLDLDLEDAGGGLILHWDPKTLALNDARVATLLVRDGPHQTRLELNRAQLASGAASYTPTGGDVTFSLETRSKGGRPVRGMLTYIDPSR